MNKFKVIMMAFGLSLICMAGCSKTSEPQVIKVPSSTENDIDQDKLKEAQAEGKEETEKTEEKAEEETQSVSENEIAYSEIDVKNAGSVSENEIKVVSENKVVKTEDGKIVIDLVMFMGQSNMSGAGGDVNHAPKVKKDQGYEFRAISDPTRLYPIEEPFGQYENNINGIFDLPGGKKGSMVSAFANKYYELTGVPIVAVSASQGGTDTNFWLDPKTTSDFGERQKRAQVWLESNNYKIRKQYVIWLQGESDALDDLSTEAYKQNMDNIIRPLFIGGVQKVFIITPGRIVEIKDYFDKIVTAQLELCKNSGYYALATTALCGISTEYMVDSWHYNQSVLNFIGEQAAESAAYYTNNTKEMCLYDYKNQKTYIPEGYDYPADTVVEPLDLNNKCGLVRY
ncbi:MAG: sialate O-acetylesterase [Lachnospiraceae bacterium]|nr:sialate O-acetylesterase [Lachnospiraceae bacterium]